MKSMGIPFIRPLEIHTLTKPFHKFTLFGLIGGFLVLSVPFLVYDSIRMIYATPINYNEGWNVFHTTRLLHGDSLYLPLNALPLIPVNYPPLSFIIIGVLSLPTGDVLLTGRVISLISMFVIGFLLYKTVYILSSDKLTAALTALLWMTLMIRMAEHYVGVYDPQLVGHVFSIGALYLYVKWMNALSPRKIILLSLLCCVALFIKHLLIVVPLVIGIELFRSNRRAFWCFASAGIMLFGLMMLGTWLYGGKDVFSHFLDVHRAVSISKMKDAIMDLFFADVASILWIPIIIVAFNLRREWSVVLIYCAVAFATGIYAVRGIGVARNAWFDFFAAASIAFGLFCAIAGETFRVVGARGYREKSPLIYHGPWLAATLVLCGLVMNEYLIRMYLSPDGFLAPATIWKIRLFQVVLVLSGVVLWFRGEKLVWRHVVIYANMFAVMLALSTKIQARLGRAIDYDALARNEEEYKKDVSLLRSIRGRSLFGEPLLGFAAGKEFVFDPFNGSRMIMAGQIRENIITDAVRNKYFSAIVFKDNIPALVKRIKVNDNEPRSTLSSRWTDNTVRAIGESYELLDAGRSRYYYFYVPRKK